MVHLIWGGYFYADGSAWVDVPPGATRLTVGRGFERKPYDRLFSIDRDTSIVVVLSRAFDLGEQGWFGGEMHAHANHGDPHYTITPVLARRIACAEGLSVIHIYDQWDNFTGSPHELSDNQTILYYTFEYRNAACGHVGLPGLRSYVGVGCCSPPSSVYPMLLDLRQVVVPSCGPMIVLAHPHTTDDYFDEDGWPGTGLGREMPVLAALGGLDAFDVASYSNDGIEDWGEWTDVVSSGGACVPSAGTDATLNSVFSPPPGGFRLYAQQSGGGPLDYDAWIDAVKAGRTFVTNYPLIPDFEVDGVRPGGTVEAQGEEASFQIRIRALCVLGLRKVALIADGAEIWSVSSPGISLKTAIDTTLTLAMRVPAALCARVEGIAGNPHALLGTPVAQTNAVRFTEAGVPRRTTLASGRMMDRLDHFEEFVDHRGGWNHPWESDSVSNRIGRARRFYSRAFRVPPGPFVLLDPGDRDTVFERALALTWSKAIDPEAGDQVAYTVSISSDSSDLGHSGCRFTTSETEWSNPLLRPDSWYWWKVEAADRGENVTGATPSVRRFWLAREIAGAEDPRSPGGPPRAVPNPSQGDVLLEGLAPPITILDPSGRLVAVIESTPEGSGGVAIWNGRNSRGDRAFPGLYWALGRKPGPVVRLIRLR